MIERRVRDQNRSLSPVSISLCIAGILAIALAMTMRVIQTKLLPAQPLMHFQLSPHFFNNLNNTYQYTLIVTLVLSGLIVDLVGPRTIISIAIGCSLLANCLFHSANSFQTLMASRFFTEFSYIFTLTGVLTLGSHWLPRRYFSSYIGLVFGTLLMTPFIVEAPLRTLITKINIINTDGIVDIIGLITLLLIVKTRSTHDYTRRRSEIYSHFNPLRYYKIWLIALVAMIGWMTNTFLVKILGLYLIGKMNLTVDQSLHIVQTSFIYFGVGAIVMGFISDVIQTKRNVIIGSYCIAAVAFCAIIFDTNLSPTCTAMLVYIIAFFASSNIICYTKSNDYSTVENSGITVGLILSVSSIGSSMLVKTMHSLLAKIVFVSTTHADWTILGVMPISLLIGALIASSLAPIQITGKKVNPSQSNPA
jgi:predicted MFS family arabinose efflux permease